MVAQRTGLAAFLVFLLSLPVWGEGKLVFEQPVQRLEASAMDQRVSTRYPFVIEGDGPVLVKRVHVNCGCTSAHLTKRDYQPGERGEIEIVFEVGDRTGFQRKKVSVETEPAQKPRPELTLEVQIAGGLRYQPNMLIWPLGGELEAKETQLSLEGFKFEAQPEVIKTSEDFQLEILPGKQADQFVLRVTPIKLAMSGTHWVELGVREQKDGPWLRRRKFFLLIRPR